MFDEEYKSQSSSLCSLLQFLSVWSSALLHAEKRKDKHDENGSYFRKFFAKETKTCLNEVGLNGEN
jgi:hypothetical protein